MKNIFRKVITYNNRCYDHKLFVEAVKELQSSMKAKSRIITISKLKLYK